jgi:hypothetical protein
VSVADAVPVTAGQVTADINQALTRGGQITGTIMAATTLAPLEIPLDIYDSAGHWVGWAESKNNGRYSTMGLPSGTYRLLFSGDWEALAYAYQFYNNKSTPATANGVVVTAPNVTPNINATMSFGAQIAGAVRAADTHQPLSGVWVSIYTAGGEYIFGRSTDAAGTYTTPGLPTGGYRLAFNGVSTSTCAAQKTYVTQYYQNKPDLTSATTINVIAPQTTGNITADLRLLGGKMYAYLSLLRRH